MYCITYNSKTDAPNIFSCLHSQTSSKAVLHNIAVTSFPCRQCRENFFYAGTTAVGSKIFRRALVVQFKNGLAVRKHQGLMVEGSQTGVFDWEFFQVGWECQPLEPIGLSCR